MTGAQKDITRDLKRVAAAHGGASRSVYLEHGQYSERQIRNVFGSYGAALQAAGVLVTPSGPKPKESKGDSNQPQDKSQLVESVEYADDKMKIVKKSEKNIRTLEELLDVCNVDLDIWEVERWKCNQWAMAGFPKTVGSSRHWHRESTAPIITPVWQVQATFKPKKNGKEVREEIEELKAELKSRASFVPRYTKQRVHGTGNILELLIPDLHAGKLAWSKETGYADYDLNISIETYRRALDSLLAQASLYSFDKIVLGVGNDLLQTDNIQGTTYSGTKVDTDSRYHKVYKTVRKMLVETIEKLRRIAPVEVKLIPGNHDTLSTFTMGDSLECRFYDYEDVIVDNEPTKAKTVEWGECFIVLVHGHEGKQADYGMWLASKWPKEFGRTKFREIHVGHKHKTALDEKFGVRVRTFSALCPPDAWHSDNTFTGNLRVAEALVWNKDRGLVAQFYHTEID